MTNANSGSDYDWHSDLKELIGARKHAPSVLFLTCSMQAPRQRRSSSMKRCSFAVVLLFVIGGFALSPTGSGWAPIFNGKDLSGWKKNGVEKWVVDQGTILCQSTENKYGYLTTDKTYTNFVLRLKFKGEAEGNSGVFVHSRITSIDPQHGPDIEGMQVEVDPGKGKHTGGLYESGGRGWVAMPTAEGENALKPGEWNDLELSVQGAHIVTKLNGVTVVEYTDPSPKFANGVIALQIHTGGGVKMRWKDIQVNEN
jgi:hypothetical protein